MRSKNCAARCYLDGGHAPPVEHEQPATMGAAKRAGIIRKGCDDSLDDLVLLAITLKPDVELITTHEANPQLNL